MGILTVLILSTSCEKLLDSPPYSEYAPENVLTNEKGIQALLFNSYHLMNPTLSTKNWVNIFECSSDIAIVSEGGEEGNVSPYATWNWDANTPWLENSLWTPLYKAIRDANIVMENIDNFEGAAETKNLLFAEAQCIRAGSYSMLYNWFGPVVLREVSGEPVNKARATEEEMLNFIETELREAADMLPDPSALPSGYEYGRFTKGSALGFLAKHYLNTGQWQEVVDVTQEIMDLGYYELYPTFRETFFVNNEGNREMLVVFPDINQVGYHNTWPNGVYSPDFYSAPNVPELVRDPAQMSAWATNFRVRDWVIDAMDANDARLIPIVDDYIDVSGANQKYSDQRSDNRRNIKFFDPNGSGNFHGCDFPWVRYADILLARAEALNQLNQSIGEARNLVIEVRERSELTDHTSVNNAAQGDGLRDVILLERAKEFMSEGKRREDLNRNGLFVQNAIDRGIALAADHKTIFPIPALEANNNTDIIQNEGY